MKKTKHDCDLQSCFLCRSCVKEWLPAIKNHKQNFEYKKGELIIREGTPVEGIYFVYKGKVKVHQKWSDNREVIIRFANEGEIFGHRGLGKEKQYPISATALEPTIVCYIDLEFFMSSLKVNHELLFKLMLFYSNELQTSERKMRNIYQMSVKGRVAIALLSIRETFGVDDDNFLKVSISRQDIASFAGTTYETAFRVMSEFIAAKAIEVTDKKIAVLDPEYLTSVIANESK